MAGSPKREMAPDKAAQLAFIKSAVGAAQRSEKKTGVPASVTIAQAILESGWGEHHMGGANNYFGIKAQAKDGKITYGDIATGYVERSPRNTTRTDGPTPLSPTFAPTEHGGFVSRSRNLSDRQALSQSTRRLRKIQRCR